MKPEQYTSYTCDDWRQVQVWTVQNGYQATGSLHIGRNRTTNRGMDPNRKHVSISRGSKHYYCPRQCNECNDRNLHTHGIPNQYGTTDGIQRSTKCIQIPNTSQRIHQLHDHTQHRSSFFQQGSSLYLNIHVLFLHYT